MSTDLTWALSRAREHTLALAADIPPEKMQLQTARDERHPAWLLGHLLLADTYLLSLLAVQPLADDFRLLLERYGPSSMPAAQGEYDSKQELIDRLTWTHGLRLARIRTMTAQDLAQPMPDAVLARAQPTLAHHLQSLVFHEGYHGGQLSSWRKAHRFSPVRWTLGPT